MSQKKASFSGHEKFECKTSWIPKALQALTTNKNLFKQTEVDQAIGQLGLGINMIKSLRHWLLMFNIYHKDQVLTDFGKTIVKSDPYLETPDTLWILHIILAEKNESATLYYLVFNQFFQNVFTKESLLSHVKQWNIENRVKVSDNTLNSDIEVFLRMYKNNMDKDSFSDSIFSELNLLHQIGDHYELNFKTPMHISNQAFLVVFLYILREKKDTTLSIKDMQYGGKVSLQNMLLMTDEQFITRLELLEELTKGKIVYREAAGLKQIYINEYLNWLDYLPKVYEEQQ